jgi:hypothetical protein
MILNLYLNPPLENQFASHGDFAHEKKGSVQLIDGKPVVPPKPGKSAPPQVTVKPQVNRFLSSIKMIINILF